jgi:hypothetical protein
VEFQSTQTKHFFIPKFETKTWDVTDLPLTSHAGHLEKL